MLKKSLYTVVSNVFFHCILIAFFLKRYFVRVNHKYGGSTHPAPFYKVTWINNMAISSSLYAFLSMLTVVSLVRTILDLPDASSMFLLFTEQLYGLSTELFVWRLRKTAFRAALSVSSWLMRLSWSLSICCACSNDCTVFSY